MVCANTNTENDAERTRVRHCKTRKNLVVLQDMHAQLLPTQYFSWRVSLLGTAHVP